MANENTPDQPWRPPSPPSHQPSPEPDPWATTPRHRLIPPPPEGEPSPYARPATNPWQAQPEPIPQPQPTPQPQPYAAYPPAPPQPTPPPSAPPAPPTGGVTGWRPNVGAMDANAFSALFDFSFTKFATPGLVKIVYLLQVIAAVGAWLLWVVSAFAAGSAFNGGAGPGLLVLLFGWIPVLLSIAFTRFVLEGIVALIRIHDRVTEIANRQQGGPAR